MLTPIPISNKTTSCTITSSLKRMDALKQKHFVGILLMFANANEVARTLARAVCLRMGSPLHVKSSRKRSIYGFTLG